MLTGFREAFTLIIGGDSQLMEIVLLSLRVSGIALALSTVIG
ncbi:MAG: tungstate transporter permease, partial [Caldilineaceae bacterium]|nr:tungstate transporter permease [Caldilineaceae bacterium]